MPEEPLIQNSVPRSTTEGPDKSIEVENDWLWRFVAFYVYFQRRPCIPCFCHVYVIVRVEIS